MQAILLLVSLTEGAKDIRARDVIHATGRTTRKTRTKNDRRKGEVTVTQLEIKTALEHAQELVEKLAIPGTPEREKEELERRLTAIQILLELRITSQDVKQVFYALLQQAKAGQKMLTLFPLAALLCGDKDSTETFAKIDWSLA